MRRAPLVSIVMPSLNQASYISLAIESVLAQDYEQIEIIIMDGGSTDDTLDILTAYAQRCDRLRWESQPDNGPADALNKAFSKVQGEYVGWLNSDDLYTPGAVNRAISEILSDPNLIMCYGHGEHINADGRILSRYPTKSPDAGLEGFVDGCFICQPTMFFKTSALTLLGGLDEGQKTSFDFEYWLRAFSAFPDRIGFVDAVQAQSRLHQACITQKMRRTVAVEGTRLVHRYLGQSSPHWIVSYLEDLRKGSSLTDAEFKGEVARIVCEVEDNLSALHLAQLRAVTG